MRKQFDKKSGAIIYKHSADELRQADAIRNAESNKKKIKALCKLLKVSEEDLEAAMEEEEG